MQILFFTFRSNLYPNFTTKYQHAKSYIIGKIIFRKTTKSSFVKTVLHTWCLKLKFSVALSMIVYVSKLGKVRGTLEGNDFSRLDWNIIHFFVIRQTTMRKSIKMLKKLHVLFIFNTYLGKCENYSIWGNLTT